MSAFAARSASRSSGSAGVSNGRRRRRCSTLRERRVVDAFHRLYYDRTRRLKQRPGSGRAVLKCPLDLWNYQEILVRRVLT